MRLEGKVALVTGGGRGIGRAIALRFAQEGAKVIVNDLRFSTAESVVIKLKELKKQAVAIEADVAKSDQVEAMFQQIETLFGRLDILVNNAGIRADAPLLDMDEQKWNRVLGVNLAGCFHCTRAAGRLMSGKQSGKIINIAAGLSSWDRSGRANYLAANYGIHGFTKAAAVELARHNIHVNCIVTDFILTDMTRGALRAQGLFAEEFREMAKALIPLRRLGTAEDVAAWALFLASDESRFMTGQEIYLRGGP